MKHAVLSRIHIFCMLHCARVFRRLSTYMCRLIYCKLKQVFALQRSLLVLKKYYFRDFNYSSCSGYLQGPLHGMGGGAGRRRVQEETVKATA